MARKKLAHPDTLDADVVAESDGAAEYIEYLRDKVSLLRIALLRQVWHQRKSAEQDRFIRRTLKRTELKK